MKIAPTLTRVVKRDYSGPYLFAGDQEDGPQAQKELRALLAVARAAAKDARILGHAKPRPDGLPCSCDLCRCLARLEKVSR